MSTKRQHRGSQPGPKAPQGAPLAPPLPRPIAPSRCNNNNEKKKPTN